jgi:hypothetical protein
MTRRVWGAFVCDLPVSPADMSAYLPIVGTSLFPIIRKRCRKPFGFQQTVGAEYLVLCVRSRLPCKSSDANSDRYNLDHPLPTLRGDRVPTDDRPTRMVGSSACNAPMRCAPECLSTGAPAAPA